MRVYRRKSLPVEERRFEKRKKKTLVSPMGFNRRASSVEKLSRANDKPFYLPFTIDVFSSAFPETSFNLRQELC